MHALRCRWFSMERVTGLEPANTSLGSSGLTTWRHPHQVSDYTLSIRKGVEGFPEGSIFYVFPALKADSVLHKPRDEPADAAVREPPRGRRDGPVCGSSAWGSSACPRNTDAFMKWNRCSLPVLSVIFCRRQRGTPTGAGKMQLINAFETSLPGTFRRRFR